MSVLPWALGSTLIALFVLWRFGRIGLVSNKEKLKIQYMAQVETQGFIHKYFDQKGIQIADIDFNQNYDLNRRIYTNTYELKVRRNFCSEQVVKDLLENPNIIKIVEIKV